MHSDGPVNVYPPRWFAAFLGRVDPQIIATEVEFLERVLPQPAFRVVLDLCCGVGRHAIPLSASGYSVIALDRDALALDVVRQASRGRDRCGPETVLGDMRALPVRSSSLDAIICMWQSFGYFDTHTNRAVLADCVRALRPGGRLIVDLYHRAYYELTVGTRRILRGETEISEIRAVEGERLHVTLTYGGTAGYDAREKTDELDWHLYSADELAADAVTVGLQLVLSCTEFDEARSPTSDDPRMQLVFARTARNH